MSFLIAILGLAFLILIHEAGHFFAARAVGMRPRKFYLGFPPPLVKKVRGGVEYGVGAIPLGGYVKIPGMHRPAPGELRSSLKEEQQDDLAHELDALDAALERGDEPAALAAMEAIEPELGGTRVYEDIKGGLAPDAYWRQTTWRKVVVIGAGPAVNIAAAFLLFVVVYLMGPTVATRTIHDVLPAHPAAAAGLQPGDTVVAIAGHPITPATLSDRINGTHGKPFKVVVQRDGKKVVLGPVSARYDATQGRYLIGIQLGTTTAPGESVPTAAGDAGRVLWRLTDAQFTGIAGLFHDQGTKQISSSVGIVKYTAEAYRTSLRDYIAFIGYISLALALLNLLPILPLDGGHIVMALLERVRGRSFSQLAYLRYSAVGLTIFLFLLYFGLRNDLGGS
jgi:regulator of sigma E protease